MNKIIPHLFFFFLLAPILSPYIGGITIYLSSIFLLFDYKFWKWLFSKVDKGKILIFVLFIIIMNILPLDINSIKTTIKMFYAALSIVYIYYTYVSDQFYLYPYLIFNICFALVQFILLFTIPSLAMLLGPTSISHFIWGKYATDTYTNFYELFFLPRVSGLSREGGFFAALVNISLLIIIYDFKLTKKRKKILIFMCILGIIVSLSKTSVIFLAGLLLLGLRGYIRKIPLIVTIFAVLFVLIYYFNNKYQSSFFFYNIQNGTLIHRFIGYAITPKLTLNNWLMGGEIPDMMTQLDHRFAYVAVAFRGFRLIHFCGIPALYLDNGIWFFLMFILFLHWLGISSMEFLLLVLFSSDVSPITADVFMQLGWFFCMYLVKNKELRNEFRLKSDFIWSQLKTNKEKSLSY